MHIDATPLVFCAVATIGGLLVYLLAAKGEAKEAGRILYFVGLLWLVASLAHLR